MEWEDEYRLRVSFPRQPDVRIVTSPQSVSEGYLRLALFAYTGLDSSAESRRALRRVETLLSARTIQRLALFGAGYSAGPVPVPTSLAAGSREIEDELNDAEPRAAALLHSEAVTAPVAMSAHLRPLVDDPHPVADLLLAATLRVWVGAVRAEWQRVADEIAAFRRRHAETAAELGWLDTLGLIHPEFIVDERDLILNMWLTEARVVAAGNEPVVVAPTFGQTRGATATPTGLQLLVPGLRPLGRDDVPPAVLPPRLRLLAALDRPRSTTDLAAALDRSPGAVSELLGALARDGFLERERQGRRVLYSRSDRGDAVLQAMLGRIG